MLAFVLDFLVVFVVLDFKYFGLLCNHICWFLPHLLKRVGEMPRKKNLILIKVFPLEPAGEVAAVLVCE